VRWAGLQLRVSCLAAACLIAACGSASGGGSPRAGVGAHVGDIAPALVGTSIEGHPISLSGWRGSVAVILFWASWCVPCQAEQPAVNSLASKEAQKGVHFAGISVDVSRSAAQSYATRFGVPYDSVIDDSESLVVSFEVAGPPTTFVIDKSGRVAAELVGELNIDDLRARITAAQSNP
jgi:thiol-disulfide isomerase/thioredoxin